MPVKSAEEAEELLAALLVPNSGYTTVRTRDMRCFVEQLLRSESDRPSSRRARGAPCSAAGASTVSAIGHTSHNI